MTETRPKRDMPKAYDPASVEGSVYERWSDAGYFTPAIDPARKPFVVIMPPPNVTGELHMGHALTTALEDLMVRWHRMKGEPTLYLPGADHAGIATQVVVERALATDGIGRHDLGRQKFVERVWTWVDQYGDRIYEQLKRLGASCDWTRRRFTLDEGPSRAVRTTFVNLYKKGLIYRGERITNWCPRCRTALSDLEVKHQEEQAELFYLRYRTEDGEGDVTVATTRPETMLGDTGVAVNPEDERYAGLVGKNVILPILGKPIPVVADGAVDREFGTGVLKVTPGHDPADFDIGRRHGLAVVNVMNPDATMNEKAGHYAGMSREECRKRIVDELDGLGLLERVEPYHHSVGHCDRCGETVEPVVSMQWYVRMEPLAKPATEAVADGRVRVIPERFAKVYFNWMDNIRDWCISRQLWWGHRIPVWYCQECDQTIVELQDPETCGGCGSSSLSRDPDVLDTWFSSALWPHSTLGWPDRTEDLDYFYPGSVMETGYDILFFWVARMIVTGIENMGEVPFHTVYLHGLVLDPEGVKMSKTRGNVLDPLQVIDVYGADALRFALTTGNSPGNDMRINEGRLEASRNFANKLWNAARFVMANLDGASGLDEWYRPERPAHRHDRWILSRLNRVVGQVEGFMQEYQFGEAQRVLHDFLWSEYCDWYIEMAKVRARSDEDGPSALPVLAFVLERVLRLLHPFMPFITEEIWRALVASLPPEPGAKDMLIVSSYPTSDSSLLDDAAEEEVEAVVEIVRAVRNFRAEFRVQPSRDVETIVAAPDTGPVIAAETSTIRALGKVDPLTVTDGPLGAAGSGERVELVLARSTVAVLLAGTVDVEGEKLRLNGELAEIDSNRDRLLGRLEDDKFVSRAPADVVERERGRLEAMDQRRSRVAEILSRLDGT